MYSSNSHPSTSGETSIVTLWQLAAVNAVAAGMFQAGCALYFSSYTSHSCILCVSSSKDYIKKNKNA